MSGSINNGITLKKNGAIIYSKKFNDVMKYLADTVCCKDAYYIYNHNPGRILRKAEDSSDPAVWWEKRKINKMPNYGRNLRENKENSALIVNVNETEFLIIEVRDNGRPGREIEISNQTRSRIDCHEALSGGRVLAVTKTGLILIYEVDYSEFLGASQVKSSQIVLNTSRGDSSFWVAVCEKSEICAIQAIERAYASRILIYSVADKTRENSITLLTELDIYSQALHYLSNACF